MAALAFPIPINCATDRVLSAGDSVIVGAGNAGAGAGLFAPVFWAIAAAQASARAAVVGTPRRAGPVVAPQSIVWMQDGISGTTNAQLAAAVNTRVLAYSPTVLFCMGSSNEWGASQATMEAAMNTITDAAKGQPGGCKVCWCSNMFGDGEQWTTASGWGLNSRDASVAALNTIIKNWADARGDVWYMNLRGDAITDANTYLQLVSQTNTPEPGLPAKPSPTGIVSSDGFHAIVADGQKKLAPLILSRLQVTL